MGKPAPAQKAMKAKKVLKAGKAKPRRLLHSKGSLRSVLAELVMGGGKVSSKDAESAMAAFAPEMRAGWPLKKGKADPKKWRTIEDVPVHVDFTRRPWLPPDWTQGIKRTHGGNTYTVYMPPGEIRTFYHQWQAEEYLGKKLTTAEGFSGQLHMAELARKQVPLEDDAFLKLLSKQERAHLVDSSKFHVCIVSARRAQTSEGARDIAGVQYAFTSMGVTPTWYVDAGSLAAYKSLGLRAKVGGKLTPARNMALDDAQRANKICVQCSDDLSQWQYRVGEQAQDRSMDGLNAAHRQARSFDISPVAAARFILAKMRSAPGDRPPKLGGAYILGDCSRTWGGEAFSRAHFILGDFFVADVGSSLRFDERLTLKEDYDFVAQHIQEHGSVMRCNRLTFSAKHYSNAGGAVDNRDDAGVKEQANMAILFEKWPRAIFPHNTRKNEVMLRWPAEGSAKELEGAAVPERLLARTGLAASSLIVATAKVPRVQYMAKRVRKVAGHTVGHAMSLLVPNAKGKACKYTCTDLKYDVRLGFLELRGPA
uniref:Uncharacterized protein n=1 Tax=Zooxanthella nutricula TaxID=1333877 RepID=A0A6U6I0K2_9DINO|mmetsp:Transcript_16153/g.47913  ORF Transcript_16153/g.47913 Transcript_16153/m.47913 type:complete len:538 (+) Transcript_16153:93-1706(+)